MYEANVTILVVETEAQLSGYSGEFTQTTAVVFDFGPS